jgi:hypothetical protein
MGIHDRDWYRDWHREKDKTPSRSWRARAVRWSGPSVWAFWIAAIVAGVVTAKLMLDYRKTAVPFPLTGEVHWYIGHQGGPLARLTLEAPNIPSAQFVVKLDQWESKQPVALIPVRGGESATVHVPLGLYRFTIVKGSLWRGPDKLFGISNEAREAIEPLSFHRTGNTIMGHTIKLETLAGNMATRPSRLGY